jgi:hypothetical protein
VSPALVKSHVNDSFFLIRVREFTSSFHQHEAVFFDDFLHFFSQMLFHEQDALVIFKIFVAFENVLRVDERVVVILSKILFELLESGNCRGQWNLHLFFKNVDNYKTADFQVEKSIKPFLKSAITAFASRHDIQNAMNVSEKISSKDSEDIPKTSSWYSDEMIWSLLKSRELIRIETTSFAARTIGNIPLWRVALFVIIVMQSSLFTMINYAKSSIKCSPALSREELETSKGQNTDRSLKLDERMIRQISRNDGFPVFFVQIFHYFANQLLLRSRQRIPASGYVFLVFELEIDSLEGSHRVFFAQTAEFD